MREKRAALVFTFSTTAAAMEAEALCREQRLPGRLIPVPTVITAGCGLAWRALPGDRALLEEAFGRGGVKWEQAAELFL